MPLAGAIAAGNCVLVKPSEVSSHSAALMTALVSKYLDPEAYRVVEGRLEIPISLMIKRDIVPMN
jgi:aldehyde dehydrogenase (NAD+)